MGGSRIACLPSHCGRGNVSAFVRCREQIRSRASRLPWTRRPLPRPPWGWPTSGSRGTRTGDVGRKVRGKQPHRSAYCLPPGRSQHARCSRMPSVLCTSLAHHWPNFYLGKKPSSPASRISRLGSSPTFPWTGQMDQAAQSKKEKVMLTEEEARTQRPRCTRAHATETPVQVIMLTHISHRSLPVHASSPPPAGARP